MPQLAVNTIYKQRVWTVKLHHFLKERASSSIGHTLLAEEPFVKLQTSFCYSLFLFFIKITLLNSIRCSVFSFYLCSYATKGTGSTAILTNPTMRARSRLQTFKSITTCPAAMFQSQLVSQTRKKFYHILTNV